MGDTDAPPAHEERDRAHIVGAELACDVTFQTLARKNHALRPRKQRAGHGQRTKAGRPCALAGEDEFFETGPGVSGAYVLIDNNERYSHYSGSRSVHAITTHPAFSQRSRKAGSSSLVRSQQRSRSVRTTAYRHDPHDEKRAADTPAPDDDACRGPQAAGAATTSQRV